MFAAQLAASALVWAGLILALARRRGAMLARMAKIRRGRRVGASVAMLSVSVAVLGAGMAALAGGGLTPSGLSWWAWPLITLAGGLFILLQTAALVPLALHVAESVTQTQARASDPQNADRP